MISYNSSLSSITLTGLSFSHWMPCFSACLWTMNTPQFLHFTVFFWWVWACLFRNQDDLNCFKQSEHWNTFFSFTKQLFSCILRFSFHVKLLQNLLQANSVLPLWWSFLWRAILFLCVATLPKTSHFHCVDAPAIIATTCYLLITILLSLF